MAVRDTLGIIFTDLENPLNQLIQNNSRLYHIRMVVIQPLQIVMIAIKSPKLLW